MGKVKPKVPVAPEKTVEYPSRVVKEAKIKKKRRRPHRIAFSEVQAFADEVKRAQEEYAFLGDMSDLVNTLPTEEALKKAKKSDIKSKIEEKRNSLPRASLPQKVQQKTYISEVEQFKAAIENPGPSRPFMFLGPLLKSKLEGDDMDM